MRHDRTKKKHSPLFFAVLIIIFLAAAAILAGKSMHKSEPLPTPEPTPVTSEPTPEPTPTPTPRPTDADGFIAVMPLEEKLMQMFIITPDALTGVKNVTLAGNTTKNALENNPVGGLIYFSNNIESRQQLASMLNTTQSMYNEKNGFPIFLGIDEEGGTVSRIASSGISVKQFESMAEIGAAEDYDRAEDVGNTIGRYLSELGFNLDFAPVADVLVNADNEVIGSRSFGSDAEIVSSMALAVADGLKSNGIIPVYKHFPGHGAATGDTHKGAVSTSRTLAQMEDNELFPFKFAISGGADMIMAAHIGAPALTGSNVPCSLSKAVVTELLRTKLEFDGVIVTDALDMDAIKENCSSEDAAVMAVEAGCDMLLMPEDYSAALAGLKSAVESGRISEERINQSVKRILSLKLSM